MPVPDDSDSVVEAVIEGLLLRGKGYTTEQLALDLGEVAEKQLTTLNVAWESAAEKQKASRTKYAQSGIKPEEVTAEVARVREALADPGTSRRSCATPCTPSDPPSPAPTMGSPPSPPSCPRDLSRA